MVGCMHIYKVSHHYMVDIDWYIYIIYIQSIVKKYMFSLVETLTCNLDFSSCCDMPRNNCTLPTRAAASAPAARVPQESALLWRVCWDIPETRPLMVQKAKNGRTQKTHVNLYMPCNTPRWTKNWPKRTKNWRSNHPDQKEKTTFFSPKSDLKLQKRGKTDRKDHGCFT